MNEERKEQVKTEIKEFCGKYGKYIVIGGGVLICGILLKKGNKSKSIENIMDANDRIFAVDLKRRHIPLSEFADNAIPELVYELGPDTIIEDCYITYKK